MALLNKKSMLGERESTSVRCSLFSHSGARANRLKITICSNGNNSELFKTPVNRLYIHMPKNDESLYGVTPSFSLLWVSADHVLVKGLGANRDQFLPRHFSRPSMKITSRVPQILKVNLDKKDLCHRNRIIIIKSKLERRNRSRSSSALWFLLYMYSTQTIYLSLSLSI